MRGSKLTRNGPISQAGRAIANRVRRAVARHRDEAAELHALITESYDSAAVIDAERRYERVLTRWPTLLGRPPDAYVGTDPLEIVHPDDVDAVSSALASREAGARSFDVRLRSASGEWTWLETTVIRVGESPKHWLLARRIDSPQERPRTDAPGPLPDEPTRRARRLIHHLNNLLHVVRGHLEAPPRPAGERPLLRRIEHSVERAAVLARQLLENRSGEPSQAREVDLRDELARSREALESRVGAPLELIVRSEVSLRVRLDPGALELALASLLVNLSLQATEKSQLVIRAFPLDGDESVAIQLDPGDPATPRAAREQCFEPISTRSEEFTRSDQGLAFVIGALEPFGGRLEVEVSSAPTCGYRIVLQRLGDRARPAPPARPAPIRATGAGGTILVVDDSDDVRALSARILAANGYRVLEAESGRRASEIAREWGAPIDLLLVDMILGDESGLEVRNRILEMHPEIESLFMSGFPDILGSPPSLDAEPPTILAKPFRSGELVAAVREQLDR